MVQCDGGVPNLRSCKILFLTDGKALLCYRQFYQAFADTTNKNLATLGRLVLEFITLNEF